MGQQDWPTKENSVLDYLALKLKVINKVSPSIPQNAAVNPKLSAEQQGEHNKDGKSRENSNC